MKFKCKKDDIKNKLSQLERITGKNLSLPVLNAILFEVKKSVVILKATNLEVGVEVVVPAQVVSDGVVALPGKEISTYLNSIGGDESILFELVENNISISTSKDSAIFKTYPIDDFPKIPRVSDGDEYKILSNEFITGLRSVLFSVSTSDIKPEIASVYIYSYTDGIVFVSTDSFRLSEKKIKTSKKINIKPTLIPYKNASEVIKFFEDENSEIALISNKSQLSIQSESVFLTTRLTDGVYPDYRQIIPSKFKTSAVVLKKDIIDTSKTTNIFLDDFNRILVKIITEDNIVEVEAKKSDLGESVSRIEAHTEGEGIEMGFNHRYFTDVFSIIESDSVALKFNEPHKPMVISGVGDTTFTYLVMPVTR